MGETESADQAPTAADGQSDPASADQPAVDPDDTKPKPAATPDTMFQGAQPDE